MDEAGPDSRRHDVYDVQGGQDGPDGERIVLLDAAGRAVGTAPKIAGHSEQTPYHLAFSSYVTDGAGRVLITRRALDKRTFPGVLTNSCCGHPGPGEGLRDAVTRRVADELGLEVAGLTLVLPEFDYRATASDGVVEHEWCPVVRARWAGGSLRPDPAEVAEAGWRTWEECQELVEHPDASPWFRFQMAQLSELGPPAEWPEADPALLPPALSW